MRVRIDGEISAAVLRLLRCVLSGEFQSGIKTTQRFLVAKNNPPAVVKLMQRHLILTNPSVLILMLFDQSVLIALNVL